MHTPAQRAGNFFFRGTGLPTVMRKNQPLVPRSNFGGKACARTTPWFSGQALLVLGHGGGGGDAVGVVSGEKAEGAWVVSSVHRRGRGWGYNCPIYPPWYTWPAQLHHPEAPINPLIGF